MTTNQTLLSLGALMLLMIVSSTMNRTYLSSVAGMLDKQIEVEATNYAQSVAEVVFSNGADYENLDANLGSFNNVTNPAERFTHVTAFGDSLYATVELGSEQTLKHGITGRKASVKVFEKDEAGYSELVEIIATVNPR
jgi:hypothetical protein